MSTKDPFDVVCEASGLSPIFGPAALKRALSRVGIDPERATRTQLIEALPEIERAIGVFLVPAKAAEAVKRVKAKLSA
jgi:hypothetical protein